MTPDGRRGCAWRVGKDDSIETIAALHANGGKEEAQIQNTERVQRARPLLFPAVIRLGQRRFVSIRLMCRRSAKPTALDFSYARL